MGSVLLVACHDCIESALEHNRAYPDHPATVNDITETAKHLEVISRDGDNFTCFVCDKQIAPGDPYGDVDYDYSRDEIYIFPPDSLCLLRPRTLSKREGIQWISQHSNNSNRC
jgi:hypothetical protein